ncbi:MAG: LPS export ABC transporter periplasmic protein LptC [Rhodospirillales bacterium CG15_BIG_FIL_POST_REV_8_21_14_020_66_15]|nr:MAG: LPS export ABC transporter periplasmic protein LptC [Rhodospirillales bacterium CG15_BIG_FIL_POST_REV_8_21_14_020_66_15]
MTAMAMDSYSGFVQVAKVMLPVAAVGLIALVILWPHLRTEDLRFRIGFAAIKSNVDGDPNLLNPRYVGTDNDNQPYAVTADIAKKLDGEGLDVRIGLELPKADITLKDGTWLVLTAENGIYARRDKTLDLAGSVNLFHDSGYEFRTEKATVDLARGVAHGEVPVKGQGPFGTLQAEGFRLLNKGRTLVFTGKSKMVLQPGAKVPAK